MTKYLSIPEHATIKRVEDDEGIKIVVEWYIESPEEFAVRMLELD